MSLVFGSEYDERDYHEESRQHQRLQKLEAFFKAVAHLTLNHDTLSSADAGMEEDYAVVFPNKLSDELEKVDPEWWKKGK